MAVTKIHAIKATVDKAIKYICNPQKTDDQVLVSSFGCAPETADLDFKFTLSHARKGNPNKAFHLIQSFMPGEITGEEANRIGKELADSLLQGKYSYVLATHVDRNHIHNHLIFCAADNIDYNKYHDCKQSYYHLRKLSDQLCSAHDKSVILEFKEHGKSYAEWQNDKKGTSWKTEIRKDINECIKAAASYDDFIRRMRAKGYTIEGESFEPDAPKYISFRPAGKDRFVRGRDRSLGKEYTKERIKERIEEKAKLRSEKLQSSPRKANDLIDTSDIKFADNPGLNRWANLENLKRFAAMYAELGRLGLQSPEELDARLSELRSTMQLSKKTIVELERKMRSFAEILSFAKQYSENKKYDAGYQKSKDPDRYYRMHQDELTLCRGAKKILENMGVDLKALNVEEMQDHHEQIQGDCARLTNSYTELEREYDKLAKIQNSIKEYMKEEQEPQKVKDRNKEL